MELNFFPLLTRFLHIRFLHIKLLLSSRCHKQIFQIFSSVRKSTMNSRFETWAWIYCVLCWEKERKIVTKLNETKTQALKVSQSVLFSQTQTQTQSQILYQRYQRNGKQVSEAQEWAEAKHKKHLEGERHDSCDISRPFRVGNSWFGS